MALTSAFETSRGSGCIIRDCGILSFADEVGSFFSFLIAGVLALLGLSVRWFLLADNSHSPEFAQRRANNYSAAAVFVSKQAPLLASMLVNPDRLEALRQVFATPEERSRSHAEFEQIKKSFLASTGLEYSRYIQPWIGDEITLAVTTPDLDGDSRNGKETGFRWPFLPKMSIAANNFSTPLAKQSRTEKTVQSELYKGVQLNYKKSLTANQKSAAISAFQPLFPAEVNFAA